MLRFALILAFAVSFPPCALTKDKIILVLDWFTNPSHGPVLVARERGYFSERGLEVEIIAPADPAAPSKMVAAGHADLALSYQPQHHLQVAAGMPLRWVGTLVSTPLSCLLTLKDARIDSVKQLRGRKIGFSLSGVDEVLLSSLLVRHGLSLDSVTLINVGWSLSSALMARQVDAVIGAFRTFEMHQIKMVGQEGRCLRLEDMGIPAYDELIYVANPNLADLGQIQKFLKATEKAARFIVDHPEESWNLFGRSFPELRDRLNKLAWSDTIPRLALRPAALDKERYMQFESFLYEAGATERVRPLSELVIDTGEQKGAGKCGQRLSSDSFAPGEMANP